MQIRKSSGKLACALSAAVVFAGTLCASGELCEPEPIGGISVGPGKFSSFETSNGRAVVVGVSDLTWDDFYYYSDYYGTMCFVDDNVVDAEKTAEDNDDDYWCGPITDMNLLFITGWAKKTKYSTVDDMVDYFRANPTLLRYATVPGDIGSVREGKYGYDGIFRWFKDTTKIDLSSSKKTSTAKLDANTFKTLMSNGEYVMNISVGFGSDNGNPKWNDYSVSHAVVCCGYETNEEGALTGLFIIDSDNDQYSGEGGLYAPNSIAYCPVEQYDGYCFVYGIWGTSSQLLNGYTALKMNVERVTLTLNANGGSVSPTSISVVEGNTYGELPEATKKNGEFDGWWTEKSGGVQVFEGDVIDLSIFPNPKKPTLYAQWHEVHKITVSGGVLSDGSTSMGGLYRDDGVDVAIDYNKLYDRYGNWVNAFSYWSYTPASADLGYEFDPYSPSTFVTMPNADVTLTANYVNNFDGCLYPYYDMMGDADSGDFYWSVDNGKTLIPFTGSVADNGFPVKSGTYTIKFYDKTGIWRAADTTITVGKRGTYRSDGVTCYEDPEYYGFYATFVPVASSIAVKFDGNGGKASTASAWFVDGYEYGYNLPYAERQGYVFAGWWTAKTGGERISSEATFMASTFAGQKTPTLYAHWLSLVKLTLKDSTASVSWYLNEDDFSSEIMDSIAMTYPELLDGDYHEGAGTIQVLSGARVHVSVAEGIEGKNDSWLTFQKWTVTPSKAEMGSTFRVTSPETEFTMPTDAVTLQATYIDEMTCGGVLPSVYASSINLGDGGSIEPPYSAFEWSPDGGKTWYKSDEFAMLKKGSYTVTWRSNDPSWQAPTTKTKVNVAVGMEEYVYGYFTFIPQVVVDVMTFENGECDLSSAGGSVTMNPKDGLVPAEKSISLTAKASDAKKYVFQGYAFRKTVWTYWDGEEYYDEVGEWYYGWGFDAMSATWKLENSVSGGLCDIPDPLFYQHIDSYDHKVHIVAVFKALSDYSEDDIQFFGLYGGNGVYNEVSYDDYGNASVDVRAVVGCSLPQSYGLGFNGVYSFPLTFKLSGKLPAGLKFDAKTGVFSGAPTKEGTASVTITATDPAGNSKDLTVNFQIDSLPTWVAGDFRAVGSDCLLEMSVTSAGKVSAKLLTRLGTRSISGTLSWTQDMDDPEGDGTFGFNPPYTKNGEMCSISFNPDGTISGYAESYLKSNGWAGGEVYGMCQDKAMLKNAAAILDKYYTFRLDSSAADADDSEDADDSHSSMVGYGYLTIKTDKKGGAKVTGQLADGEKVSVSGLLLPVDDGYGAMLHLFASPSSYKKDGCFVMSLYLSDGYVSPMDEGSWSVGSETMYRVSGYGTEYSAASSLEGYYWMISCPETSGVLQEYSWKETYTGDNGKPVSYTVYDNVSAVDLGGLFSVSVMGDKKGSVVLAEKSSAPWQEKETWKDDDGRTYTDTWWNYYEDKNGNPITNPSQLSVSFTKATGIFTGKATVYFDYEVPSYKKNRYGDYDVTYTMQHKTASVPYAGVMIVDDGSLSGYGAAVYTYKHTSFDEETGRTKSVTDKVSLPVILE